MIKFFRQIRQNMIRDNRASKYLLYAIGEIILVVIGILIALQINNWNEERKAGLSEKLVMTNLIQDLRSDSLSYNKNLITLQEINKVHQELYKIGFLKDSNTVLTNANYVRRLPYYNAITRENDPDVASKISTDAIRKEIQVYFRNVKDMDDVYNDFERVIKDKIRPYLSEKITYDMDAWFKDPNIESTTIIRSEKLAELARVPYFQQLVFEASLKSSEARYALMQLLESNHRLIKVLENRLAK